MILQNDLFIDIEWMPTNERSSKQTSLEIRYAFANSLFGELLIAATDTGVCYLCFIDNPNEAVADLKKRFPTATLKHQSDPIQQQALNFFTRDYQHKKRLKLHLAATAFQQKVWSSLLQIPQGGLVTYGDIATRINSPRAARAVGGAVGRNPVAFLIPCHRVIQQTGRLGGYRWGAERKAAMLNWEAAQTDIAKQPLIQ